MPTFLINAVHYHIRIQGSGTPLALLHGFTGSAASWADLAVSLQDRYQIIAVDLLGHGQTDAPPDPARYTIEKSAADLDALFKTLHLAPVHLLGYSMGGRLALYFALHYPIRTLILESASPGLASEPERQARAASDSALADQIERDGILAFVHYWESIPLFATQQNLSESARARLRMQRLGNRPQGLANSLRGMGTGVQASQWDHLAQLQLRRIPTMLLAGALDTKFVSIAEQMHARIAGSKLTTVPHAGHSIYLEQPETYRIAVSEWLAGH